MEHLELVDRIYFEVKRMIFDQRLKPGQKLVQEKLSEELGVSRSPLLKALQRLESEFLVEQIPRRGMYVKRMTEKEIVDVFQCRAVIEGLSARLATGVIDPAGIDELRGYFRPFQGRESIEVFAYAEADRSFHTRIMQWSGNAVILRLEVLSNIHLKAYQAGLLRPPERTLPEHFAIIEAMARGDGALAEQLMRAHIERSIEALLSGEGEKKIHWPG